MSTQLIEDRDSANIFANGFDVTTAIARGRSSVVYKASKQHNLFAIKVYNQSNKAQEDFTIRVKREALALLSLRHPHVVKLYDFIAEQDRCYAVLEYAEQGDLSRFIQSDVESPKPRLALKLIEQALSGLQAVHNVGIIHRDIKPENILLFKDAKVKLADFDQARIPSEELKLKNMQSSGIGTFDYLAPEVLQGAESSVVSDLYSVGVTLYQLLTKRTPFRGKTFVEQIENKMNGNRTPLNRYLKVVPKQIELLLDKALAVEPKERFTSALEFRRAIEESLEERWEPNKTLVNPEKAVQVQIEKPAKKLFSFLKRT